MSNLSEGNHLLEALANPDTRPPALQQECQAILDELMQRAPALVFASLATLDGRSFAHAAAGPDPAKQQRVAALSSSLFALSASFAKEALHSPCTYAAISTSSGSIVIVCVPTNKRMYALSTCADKTENMAMAMRLTLDTADVLARALDRAL